MIIRNEDVIKVTVEVPPGHLHLRTTVVLADGSEMVFQEATIANIVRAYVRVKTHPLESRIVLKGEALAERKEGFAEWQLVEE